MRFVFEPAEQKDQAEILELFRVPMAGSISLALERDPDYFAGALVQNANPAVFVGRDTLNGRITGLFSVGTRPVFVNGKVSVGHIVVGYSGLLLLGAASLAIGLFASAVAKSQVVAALIGTLILAPLVLLWAVAKAVDPPLNRVLTSLAIHHENFRPFMNGILELDGVVYYAAVTYFFLLAATKTLEARRWR